MCLSYVILYEVSYMNKSTLLIPLTPTLLQAQSLQALQRAFAEVCNALAPTVRDTRCWNRVTLHHLAYRALRERFPQVGSQMVCNAIYSVSRTCRVIFQSPSSPLHIQRLTDKPLPLLQFLPSAPVYFDRHTLSIRYGVLSMYTLDGRMRFQINLAPQDEERFANGRLQEIVLRGAGQQFSLSFSFGDESAQVAGALPDEAVWPQYVVLQQDGDASECLLPEGFPKILSSQERALTQVGVAL
jgi:hypothetical protein